MRKFFVAAWVGLGCWNLFGAELNFDFSRFPVGSSPTGFVSTVSGQGEPGQWKVVEDTMDAALTPLTPNVPGSVKRLALAQISRQKIDEHFPMLIYEAETFKDFTLTTRFKCADGEMEQMAGFAFRVQDEKNFYVVRASALGDTFRFYKVVNGERSPAIGPSIDVPTGIWQELAIECKGNQIRCLLNGKEVIPTLTDNTFSAGRFAFWTKSDSVSHFIDTKIVYTPRVPAAQKIISDMMREYPRLIGLKIFSTNAANELRVIASSDQANLGEAGESAEANVLLEGIPYYAKAKETVSVILPVRDRNGDTVAALRVIMKPFPGQTEGNVYARAKPIVKAIEARIVSLRDLTE